MAAVAHAERAGRGGFCVGDLARDRISLRSRPSTQS